MKKRIVALALGASLDNAVGLDDTGVVNEERYALSSLHTEEGLDTDRYTLRHRNQEKFRSSAGG